MTDEVDVREADVLILDDELPIRRVIALVCESLGLSSIQVESNQAALSLTSKWLPLLATTDLVHPGESGIEFVRAIRDSPEASNLPILMITGNATPRDELVAWRAGVTAFLPKPFGFDELARAILRLTERASDIDLALLGLGREGKDLDYKERLDLESKTSRAELARDVMAMANSGGGRMIIGVQEKDGQFIQSGLPQADLQQYETTRLNDCIRRYVGSTASLSTRIVCEKGLFFVIAEVPASSDTIALALEGNENAGLFRGRIYVRTQDGRTVELTDPLQLQRLIDRLVDLRVSRLLPSQNRE